MKQQSLLLFLTLYGFTVFAQETDAMGALITDRPDATEAPNLVRKGFLQLETGALYEEFEEGDIHQEVWTYNTGLLRYGLLDNLELRLGWDFQDVSTTINGMQLADIQSGFTPLLAGVKIFSLAFQTPNDLTSEPD